MKKDKEKNIFRKIGGITNWIATLFAAVVSLIGVIAYVSKPEPPDLRVKFLLSDAPRLFLSTGHFPIGPAGGPISFPMSLSIENLGEKTAHNCMLKVIHPRDFTISTTSNSLRLNQEQFYDGSLVGTISTISLPSIHPGVTLHYGHSFSLSDHNEVSSKPEAFDIIEIDRILRTDFNVYFKKSADGKVVPLRFEYPTYNGYISEYPKPGGGYAMYFDDLQAEMKSTRSILEPITYELETRICAEDMPEKEASLYITIGPLEALQKLVGEDVPIFEYYRDEEQYKILIYVNRQARHK